MKKVVVVGGSAWFAAAISDSELAKMKRIESIPMAVELTDQKNRTSKGDRIRKRQGFNKK